MGIFKRIKEKKELLDLTVSLAIDDFCDSVWESAEHFVKNPKAETKSLLAGCRVAKRGSPLYKYMCQKVDINKGEANNYLLFTHNNLTNTAVAFPWTTDRNNSFIHNMYVDYIKKYTRFDVSSIKEKPEHLDDYVTNKTHGQQDKVVVANSLQDLLNNLDEQFIAHQAKTGAKPDPISDHAFYNMFERKMQDYQSDLKYYLNKVEALEEKNADLEMAKRIAKDPAVVKALSKHQMWNTQDMSNPEQHIKEIRQAIVHYVQNIKPFESVAQRMTQRSIETNAENIQHAENRAEQRKAMQEDVYAMQDTQRDLKNEQWSLKHKLNQKEEEIKKQNNKIKTAEKNIEDEFGPQRR